MGNPIKYRDPRGLENCGVALNHVGHDDSVRSGPSDAEDDFGDDNSCAGEGGIDPDTGDGGGIDLSACYASQLLPGPLSPLCYTPVPYIPQQQVQQQPTCEEKLDDEIYSFLSTKGSPLASYTDTIIGDAYYLGLNPLLLVAIAGEESNYGLKPNAVATNNAFGLMGKAGLWNFVKSGGDWANGIQGSQPIPSQISMRRGKQHSKFTV